MEEHNLIYAVEPPAEVPVQNEEPRTFGPPRRRFRSLRALVLGLALLFLVAFSTFLLAGSRFYAGVTEGEAALERAQVAALDLDFETAALELETARQSFVRIQNGLKWVRWTYPLPWIGDQVQGVTVIVDAGVESIAAIHQALVIAADVLEVVHEAEELLALGELPKEDYSFEDFPPEQKAHLLEALQKHLRLHFGHPV